MSLLVERCVSSSPSSPVYNFVDLLGADLGGDGLSLQGGRKEQTMRPLSCGYQTSKFGEITFYNDEISCPKPYFLANYAVACRVVGPIGGICTRRECA